MSVRGFAAYLGVSERTVSKWESGAETIYPLPVSQALLDTALNRADQGVRERFDSALTQLQSRNDPDRKPEQVVEERVGSELSANLSLYRRAVADRLTNVRLLRRSLSIQDHYFRSQAEGSSGDRVDAVELLLAKSPRRICLLGPSGAGKTATLRRLLYETTEQHLPFYIPLRDYTNRNARGADWVDLPRWLDTSVTPYGLDATTTNDLHGLIHARKGLFIFDGFDELRFDTTWAIRIADTIEAFFAGYIDEAKVIITSRSEEDLQGRFSGYAYYHLMPVDKNQVREFARTVGLELPATNYLLDELSHRPFFELRPVMLLFALLGLDGADTEGLKGVDTRFGIFERALARLLREERQVPPSKHLMNLSPEDMRSLRLYILESMVRGWKVSGQPVRLPESKIRAYLTEAFKTVLNRRQIATQEVLRYLVPTGICLELEEKTEISYVFVHNSVQEFLYARILLACIRDVNVKTSQDLMSRDYYSAEILGLLGEALTESDMATLLRWALNPEESRMVRKVSLGVLGFVHDQRHIPGLAQSLTRAFEKETDIGVAGRIAEALRRLGRPQVIREFIDKLDRYPERPGGPDSLSRPLTFEIDEPLPGLEEFRPKLEQHLKHPTPLVRKHVLIEMMRGHTVPVHAIVRFCLQEVKEVEALGDTAVTSETVENLRSLRYGLEALRRFGSRFELQLAQHLLRRLSELSWIDKVVLADLRRVLEELRQRGTSSSWPNTLEQAEGLHVYLIRHGESDGNRDKRLLGSRIDGNLTNRGLLQAEALAAQLRNRLNGGQIHLVSAPTARARETAKILADTINRVPVEIEPLLTELDFGEWTGRTRAEIHSTVPLLYTAWERDPWEHHPPGGESLYEVWARAREGFERQMGKMMSARHQKIGIGELGHPATLIFISHFYPLSALFEAAVGTALEPRPVNCAITHLVIEDGRWRVVEVDETGHLDDIGFEGVGI